MNRDYFFQIWRRNVIKVLAVTGGAVIWGFLAGVIFHTIQPLIARLPANLTKFGSGSIATFPGMLTVMFEHPLLIAMACTVVIGITVPAIAGARQRGTLEMLLARPLSRTRLVATVAIAVLTMLMVVFIGLLVGVVVGTAFEGLGDQLPVAQLPLVWLNAVLLFAAFAAVALAASASSNRNGPAVAITLAFLLGNYFIEILGGYLRRADGGEEPWQTYNLFHHFQPVMILAGNASLFDLALLGGVIALAVGYALVAFRRRDLPAPG